MRVSSFETANLCVQQLQIGPQWFVPIRGRVEGLMPSGNIGYRLIMSATPLWLETTGAGRVQNPAYRASGQIKNATIWLRFFYSCVYLFDISRTHA